MRILDDVIGADRGLGNMAVKATTSHALIEHVEVWVPADDESPKPDTDPQPASEAEN